MRITRSLKIHNTIAYLFDKNTQNQTTCMKKSGTTFGLQF